MCYIIAFFLANQGSQEWGDFSKVEESENTQEPRFTGDLEPSSSSPWPTTLSIMTSASDSTSKLPNDTARPNNLE